MYWIALRPQLEAGALPDVPLGAPARLLPTLESDEVWSALAWRCLQLTPLVALVDGVLVMEVSGSARLFGGQQALLRRIYMENKTLARVCYAQGATSLVAIGRLLAATPVRAAVPLHALPLPVLAAARPHAALLARMGVRTWGQLRALPRAGVARRFGQDLLDALDRAWGEAPETYAWLRAPEVFARRVELSASVDAAPGLLFAARRLLVLLLEWLRARQHGVLALELVWELDVRRANTRHRDAHHQGGHIGTLVLRTAQPTQDMGHLQRLLAERLAQVQLPAPVLYLRLHSLQTAALKGASHSLLIEDLRSGEALAPTLERLAARLGPAQVLGVQLCDDHRPAHMQRWGTHPVLEPQLLNAAKKGTICAASVRVGPQFGMEVTAMHALLPPVLLEVPQPVAEADLQLLGSVQRLEAGWWEGTPVLRDYQLARLPGRGLAWVFCERLRAGAGDASRRWFLHGIFG